MGHFSSNDFWDFILGSFFLGYIFFSPILLLLRLIPVKPVRQEAVNFLSIVNLTFSFTVLLRMLLLISELTLYGQDQEDYYYSLANIPDELFDVILFILTSIIGILFFFKRMRKSWMLTIVLLLLLNANFILNNYIKLFKDHSPAEWESEYSGLSHQYVLKGVLFVIVCFILYLSYSKKKNLPFPSVLFK